MPLPAPPCRKATTACIGLLVLVSTAGCGAVPGRDDRNGMTVRDSAGVVIVEHGPDLPSGVEHWSLDSTPLLDIGKAEGEEPYLFTRILHASASPRGELIVAERPSGEFRLFDSTGKAVGRVGRKGSGPGEFQNLAWVDVDRAGLMAAYDASLRRLTRFSSEGTLLEEVSLRSLPAGSVLGQFGDGSLLFRRLIGLPGKSDLEKPSTGLVRDSLGLFLVSPDGASSTPVARLPGIQDVRAVGNGGVFAMEPAPFGLETVIAIADTIFYVSTQESWEIRAYRKNGSLLRIVRRRVGPEPVTATARAEWQRQRNERLERWRSGPPLPPAIRAVAEYSTLPDVFPAHGELRVDRLGNIWVGDYRPFPSQDTLSTWIVLGPDGAIRATAELPSAQITEIGRDRVVGVWTEEDVPHVRLYRMVKRDPGN